MKIATFEGPLEVGADYWRALPASRFDQMAPRFFDPRQPHNVGDWFLTKIVDRVLDYDELVVLFPDSPARVWAEVNSSCDAVVLRGGNYIAPNFLSTAIGRDAIERIEIPIILFGAGIQNVPEGGVPFTDDEVAILRHVHGSCTSSAVRGDRTAEVLASIGIENTVVTGCPTFYWSRAPGLLVRDPAPGRAAFTFRHGLFTDDPAAYQAMFRSLDLVRDRFDDVVVVLQGEEVVLQRLYQMRVWGAEHLATMQYGPGKDVRLHRETLDEAALADEAQSLYAPWAEPGTIEALLSRTFFSWDISDYLELFSQQDIVIGCRLHSNLLALANGTPAYFLTYDDRTREMAEFLGVPSCPLLRFSADVDVVAQDWKAVERRYRVGFGRFTEFLTGNDLQHKLTTGDIAPMAGARS